MALTGVAARDIGIASALLNAAQQVGGYRTHHPGRGQLRPHRSLRAGGQDIVAATVHGWNAAFLTCAAVLTTATAVQTALVRTTPSTAHRPFPDTDDLVVSSR